MWSRFARSMPAARRRFAASLAASGVAASSASLLAAGPAGMPRCDDLAGPELGQGAPETTTKKRKAKIAATDEAPDVPPEPPTPPPVPVSSPKAARPVPPPARREGPKAISTIIYADLLHGHREIFVTGTISDAMAKEVIAQLLYLERQQPGQPITLLINSGGGKVAAGMAIHDVMRDITSPVHTLCLGRCSSMAAVLLAAGERGGRRATPHCRVMVHQPHVKLVGSKRSRDLAISQSQIERSNVMTQQLLREYTGLPIERVQEMLEVDYYMSAQEALDSGIVDSIGGPLHHPDPAPEVV